MADPVEELATSHVAPEEDFPAKSVKKGPGRPKGATNKLDADESRFLKAQRGRRESDLFASQVAGTKYNVSRIKPEVDPATGDSIAGWLNSHVPPFHFEDLRQLYGGGVYLVTRFESGQRTNEDEVRIAGPPRTLPRPAPPEPPKASVPPAAPPPANVTAAAPSLGELVTVAVTLAKAMQPPPAPPVPSVKDNLESLVAMKEIASGLFGERERPVGEGLAGIVSAIPAKFFENISEAALTFARKFGSEPAPIPVPVALPQNGAPVNVQSENEKIASAIKAAVLAGVQTGSPTPEELAKELVGLSQAKSFLPYLEKVDAPSIVKLLEGKLAPKTRALLDNPEVRRYVIATIQAARALQKGDHAKSNPA